METVLHVIKGLPHGRAARMLKRLVLAEQDAHTSRQVVISLTTGGAYGRSLRAAGVEFYCLGMGKLSRWPSAFLRLIRLMRSIQPDVVMTWRYHADFLGTLAALMSGIEKSRVVWNLSYSTPNAPRDKPTARWILVLLVWLSPIPGAIASGSLGRRAHEALGYCPRRWFHLCNGTSGVPLQRALKSYRQLWQFTSVIASARLQRTRSDAIFIAVTGSSSKSTTTKLLSHILAGVARVRAQVEDNELKDCLRTLGGTTTEHDFVVCEIGTHRPGALKPMIDLLKPSVGIVTLVGLEHYSKFRTYDAVAQEKATLIEALPADGLAVLNHNDVRVASMASQTEARVVTYGESDGDYKVQDIQAHTPGALSLSICHRGNCFDVTTCLTGSHNSLAVAAAFCCAHSLGVPATLIQERIATFEPLFGRCSVHHVEDGPVFILDTHKGPYYSFYLPINMMAHFSAPRKRIVVGHISDSGNTNPKYRDVYRAARLVADQVIFVGDNAHRSKATAEEISEGRFVERRSVKEAAEFIKETAIPGEIVLVKSAQNLHLERLFLGFPCAVQCWEQKCGHKNHCIECAKYELPFEKHREPSTQ
jgi:UDP-N-acetylmuramoyl-tripeptide--D-alanyl-D-alanine ligase